MRLLLIFIALGMLGMAFSVNDYYSGCVASNSEDSCKFLALNYTDNDSCGVVGMQNEVGSTALGYSLTQIINTSGNYNLSISYKHIASGCGGTWPYSYFSINGVKIIGDTCNAGTVSGTAYTVDYNSTHFNYSTTAIPKDNGNLTLVNYVIGDGGVTTLKFSVSVKTNDSQRIYLGTINNSLNVPTYQNLINFASNTTHDNIPSYAEGQIGIGSSSLKTKYDYSGTTTSTYWCNVNLLFSGTLLKPAITYIPSFAKLYSTRYEYYQPYTLVSYIPNNTATFIKDNDFNNWYYVPPFICYDGNVTAASVYSLATTDSCASSVSGTIDYLTIFNQNKNVSCTYNNITSPYYIECEGTDTSGTATGWKLYSYNQQYNASVLECSNSTASGAMRCSFNPNNTYYIAIMATIQGTDYIAGQFSYNTEQALPFSYFGNFVFVMMIIFIVTLGLAVGTIPEFMMLGIFGAFAFMMYMGFIGFSYQLVVLVLIVSFGLMFLFRR